MAQHVIVWRLGTCGCVVHELWEDSGNTRVLVGYVTEAEAEAVNEARRQDPAMGHKTIAHAVNPAVACDAHKSLSGVALYNTVKHESRVLCDMVRLTHENFPELFETVLDSNGDTVTRYKPGKEPNWSFDPADRSLTYALPLTTADKAKLRGKLKGLGYAYNTKL